MTKYAMPLRWHSTPPGIDYFRAGYETVRLDCEFSAPVCMTEDAAESYLRGQLFARQCKATGYELKPWPPGVRSSPQGAQNAFNKSQRMGSRKNGR